MASGAAPACLLDFWAQRINEEIAEAERSSVCVCVCVWSSLTFCPRGPSLFLSLSSLPFVLRASHTGRDGACGALQRLGDGQHADGLSVCQSGRLHRVAHMVRCIHVRAPRRPSPRESHMPVCVCVCVREGMFDCDIS
jgi:hypothetical protein